MMEILTNDAYLWYAEIWNKIKKRTQHIGTARWKGSLFFRWWRVRGGRVVHVSLQLCNWTTPTYTSCLSQQFSNWFTLTVHGIPYLDSLPSRLLCNLLSFMINDQFKFVSLHDDEQHLCDRTIVREFIFTYHLVVKSSQFPTFVWLILISTWWITWP